MIGKLRTREEAHGVASVAIQRAFNRLTTGEVWAQVRDFPRSLGRPGTSTSARRALDWRSGLFGWRRPLRRFIAHFGQRGLGQQERSRDRDGILERQRAAQMAVPTAHAFDALPEYLDLAVSLATRPTETLTLKFADIDWLNRFIAVRKTKSGKDRVLPLNNTAVAALLAMKERKHPKSDLVFHRADGRAWKDMRATFTSAVRAADLWHAEPLYQVTRHTLRHTALSWMAQQGEPLQKIARFAGHSSTHVTETYYAHLQPDHLTHAAGVIDAALGNLYPLWYPLRPIAVTRPACRSRLKHLINFSLRR